MDPFEYPDGPDGPDGDKCDGTYYVGPGPGATDTKVQLTISLLLGVSAFLTFCVRYPYTIGAPYLRVSG